MPGQPRLGDDPVALARAFAGFARGDVLRAVVAAAGGCALVALVTAYAAPGAISDPTASEPSKNS